MSLGSQKIFEFMTGTERDCEPDFYAVLPVRQWAGKSWYFTGSLENVFSATSIAKRTCGVRRNRVRTFISRPVPAG